MRNIFPSYQKEPWPNASVLFDAEAKLRNDETLTDSELAAVLTVIEKRGRILAREKPDVERLQRAMKRLEKSHAVWKDRYYRQVIQTDKWRKAYEAELEPRRQMQKRIILAIDSVLTKILGSKISLAWKNQWPV